MITNEFSRRGVLSLLAAPVARLCGQVQGMASRTVKPAPRGKASGVPFGARFTDVGRQAGLNEIVVCGHADRCDYIIETMSCGAAFLDYDNDGWLDIFVLVRFAIRRSSGERIEPALQKQSRRHFHRCHKEGRTVSHRIRVRRDGRGLQQRRVRRSLHHLLGPERPATATTAMARSPM